MGSRVPRVDAMSSPGVRFPPPFLFVAAFGIGWLIETRVKRAPITMSPDLSSGRAIIGWVLLAGGFALLAWGMVTFARARTAIIPNRPAATIVESGPYRFTRNPMYVGFTVAHVGGALLLNSAWPVVMLPVALIALKLLVIVREERYLTEAFGAEYTAYQGRVRRWL